MNERAPFCLLARKAEEGRAEFWELYDGEFLAGFAYVVRSRDLAYLFYFAICPELRGKGYGSASLSALKKQYEGCRLFLALETPDASAPNNEQRLKRHAFYQNCGLSDLPYKLKEASVVYSLMGDGGEIAPEEYQEMMDAYLGRFLRRLVDMRFLDGVEER